MEKDMRRTQRTIYVPIWLDNKIVQLAKQKSKTYNDITNTMLEEYFEKDPQEE